MDLRGGEQIQYMILEDECQGGGLKLMELRGGEQVPVHDP